MVFFVFFVPPPPPPLFFYVEGGGLVKLGIIIVFGIELLLSSINLWDGLFSLICMTLYELFSNSADTF